LRSSQVFIPGADWQDMRIIGLLLVAGAALTLALHQVGAPDELYRWLYEHLLAGRDVPEEPPRWSLDAIGYVSLIGGLAELAAGTAVLVVDRFRTRQP
jgi:hypothetical protein